MAAWALLYLGRSFWKVVWLTHELFVPLLMVTQYSSNTKRTCQRSQGRVTCVISLGATRHKKSVFATNRTWSKWHSRNLSQPVSLNYRRLWNKREQESTNTHWLQKREVLFFCRNNNFNLLIDPTVKKKAKAGSKAQEGKLQRALRIPAPEAGHTGVRFQ